MIHRAIDSPSWDTKIFRSADPSCVCKATHGFFWGRGIGAPAAVLLGVGAALALSLPVASAAPVAQAVAISAGGGSYAGVLGGDA